MFSHSVSYIHCSLVMVGGEGGGERGEVGRGRVRTAVMRREREREDVRGEVEMKMMMQTG